MSDSGHVCHARDCTKAVPPKRLMCEAHWRAVPYQIRKAVLENYREGQEHKRVEPTRAWVKAAKAARESISGQPTRG